MPASLDPPVIFFFAKITADETMINEATKVIIRTWAGNSGTEGDGAVVVGLGDKTAAL